MNFEVKTNSQKTPNATIDGLLKVGHKMLVTGSSKCGKSCSLIELAIALAEGKNWLGFKCELSKVLYVNLESNSTCFLNRFNEVYRALNFIPGHNILVWNLRGRLFSIEKFWHKIKTQIKAEGVNVVIIDPLYKVLPCDERDFVGVRDFFNELDKLCSSLGVTLVYCETGVKVTDNDSGVLATCSDAVVDFKPIKSKAEKDGIVTIAKFTTSEFKTPKSLRTIFRYPIHIVGDGGDGETK